MKKITKIFALLCAVICLALCFTACSKEEYTYWQTDRKASGETILEYTAQFSFGSSTVKIKEVWINISNVEFNPNSKETTIDIEFLRTTSSTAKPEVKSLKVKSAELKEAKKSKGGWMQLLFEQAITCNQATVIVVDQMRINEICFIKEDGKLASVTFSKGGVMAGNLGKLYTTEELNALPETDYAYDKNGNYAFNLIDEQDKFPLEYITTKA